MGPYQQWTGIPLLQPRKRASPSCESYSWSWRGAVCLSTTTFKGNSWKLADASSSLPPWCPSWHPSSFVYMYISENSHINAFLREIDRVSTFLDFWGNFSRSNHGKPGLFCCWQNANMLGSGLGLQLSSPCSYITRAWGALCSHVRLWMILWLPITSWVSGCRTEVLVIREYLFQPESPWSSVEPAMTSERVGRSGLGS